MIKKTIIAVSLIIMIYILINYIHIQPQQPQQNEIEKLYIEKSKIIINKKNILQEKQIVDKRLQELNTTIEEIDGKIKSEINSGLDFQ